MWSWPHLSPRSRPFRLSGPRTIRRDWCISSCRKPRAAVPTPSRAPSGRSRESWGQPVVIENKAGAGGVVGTDFVAKAPADGYTLLVSYEGSQALNQSLYQSLPFDSLKDFYPHRDHRGDTVPS